MILTYNIIPLFVAIPLAGAFLTSLAGKKIKGLADVLGVLTTASLFILSVYCVSALLSCKDVFVISPDSNQNVEDFEAAWNRINDVYPYLEFKNINWDSIYTVYRPLAENAQGDDFYLVLRGFSLLSDLDYTKSHQVQMHRNLQRYFRQLI